ncbi:efflux RND transporter periplasmic adaptor subunit [Shewanella surugensis]|uniref:Efflux RND transporter periplasmic adaptor subunit n=1 Tax=Shewanella surugensis TaxID=212020 RepID=A0ABT0LFG2_9GAMM|nr:efflux RND transporter periplasmic adaptor subunit [Shewanella surugensis]MCL1126085.1 efflux RND transporter periplasmic adaptor subunit [Shewanella surugensis]
MKKILVIFVLVLTALGYHFLKEEQLTQANARPMVNVVVAKVTMGPIREEVEALGTTQANESIIVTSKVSDVVTKVNFSDGDKVKKGQLLIQLHDRAQAAQVTIAKVQLHDHIRELERIRELVTSQTVAVSERDRLQTAIDTANAQLLEADAALADRKIKAPFAGVLGLRQVSLGALVSPGDEITTLDDISVIKLDFSVPERFLQAIKVGNKVEAKAVAFDDEQFIGKVASIDSRVNPATRAVIVRTDIPNPEGRLLPGMLMTVKLIKSSREALILPESAIIPIQERHYVYVVDSEGVVSRQLVTLGIRKRGWVEIVDGIQLDQQVIVRGILKVRPGDKVSVSLSENFSFLEQAKVEPIA